MSTDTEKRRLRVTGLDVHVTSVIALGVITVAHSLYVLVTAPPPSEWIIFAVLGLVAGAYAVKIPGVNALVSASDTFFIASVMLFGPAPAVLALALDGAWLARRRSYETTKLLFNATAPSVSLMAASLVFAFLIGQPSVYGPELPITGVILPLVALTAVYFALNSGLAAAAIALESGVGFVTVWRRLTAARRELHRGGVGRLLPRHRDAHRRRLLATSAVLPLVVMFHVTLRSVLGRLGDAQLHVERVDRLYLSTIETLATAIEAKDGVTHDHIRRVQRFAVGLAKALDITDDETIKAIKAAALLHDTGKLAVPEHILNKPGKLTAAEFEQMKLHVDVGADILSSIDFPYPVVPIVRAHHESWDGSGYPRGLAGEQIPIGARILSVVDCYDALTSDRPYRPALTDEQALAIIIERRGTMYDPRVVDMFLTVCPQISAVAMEPVPHQEALTRIGRAMIAPPPPAAPPTRDVDADAPEDFLAIVSLSRVMGGDATLQDAAALATTHLSRLLPDTTCVFYVRETATERVVARYASGAHAATLLGTSMAVGERLTGWVAACRQTIANSDAALDLFDRGVKLGSALSTPLVDGDRVVGVLTVYAAAAQAFTGNQSRLVEMMAPHLGRVVSLALRGESQRAGESAAVRAGSGVFRDFRVVSK